MSVPGTCSQRIVLQHGRIRRRAIPFVGPSVVPSAVTSRRRRRRGSGLSESRTFVVVLLRPHVEMRLQDHPPVHHAFEAGLRHVEVVRASSGTPTHSERGHIQHVAADLSSWNDGRGNPRHRAKCFHTSGVSKEVKTVFIFGYLFKIYESVRTGGASDSPCGGRKPRRCVGPNSCRRCRGRTIRRRRIPARHAESDGARKGRCRSARQVDLRSRRP